MELYDLIKQIHKRPALYLGKKSLSHLQVFLDGYTFARRQSDLPLSEQEREFDRFQTWIEQRFGQLDTQSWTKIILFYAEDETQALELFFELFDEFLIAQNKQLVNSTSRSLKPLEQPLESVQDDVIRYDYPFTPAVPVEEWNVLK